MDEFKGYLTVLYVDGKPVDYAFHTEPQADTIVLDHGSLIHFESEVYHLPEACGEWTEKYGSVFVARTKAVVIDAETFKHMED